MDRRRRQWLPFSALFPHSRTPRRLQEEFGRDGLLVWALFLAACKRSPVQGVFSYTTEEAAWAELGLLDPDDRPRFSLVDFFAFTGRLKQTRTTRIGRVVNVTATRWGQWQKSVRRQVEAEQKARKRQENTPDKNRTDSDLDLDLDSDRDLDGVGSSNGSGLLEQHHQIREKIEAALGGRGA